MSVKNIYLLVFLKKCAFVLMAFNCKDALVIIIENVIVNVCDFKHYDMFYDMC